MSRALKNRYRADFNKLPKIVQYWQRKRQLEMTPPAMRPLENSLPPEEQKDMFDTDMLPGDRVQYISGKDKGLITTIAQYHKETGGYFTTEGGEMKSQVVPKDLWMEGQTSHVMTHSLPTPAKNLRLVADVPSEDGGVKTVAVQNVVMKGSYFDPEYRRTMKIRRVLGDEQLIIPWPTPKEVKPGVMSTTEDLVIERTHYFESIAKPPFPLDVLPDIMNVKNKKKKQLLTEKTARHLNAPKMPLSEKAIARMAEKKRLGEAKKAHLESDLIPQIEEFVGKRVEAFFAEKKGEGNVKDVN